ncbi:hypothetical protein BATDEDRAFT_92476 [Batrachochytrium dendrobatidis JAM81]|uniref:Tail specific protease domain-containing protein n=1 Tax=Batrachochytrium dendrobatidis (strain JAM81 / FGSC 10211) TaxID=684364 RepID=F4PDJ1_BATDJ|nr:uncharacterized protein BATDEDRAFT_92476 [Batrachochytrium dendrobatidis JAM81]EGF76687.1 hypothetical protein BATDEDRAFT_92476 [Batrachochytrium dendrobatidis JAM81]|eukprot:XP_006682689.1 hypothetical protein BATDEDRAFT_92476 [Batrachochytrium dendrobatidis JAM81]
MIQHVQAWVNLESKIKHHGQQANPFPALEHIRNNIGTLTDEQLQLGLLDAFARARDGHTAMTLAGPYSCFFVTTGISFQFIDGPGNMIKNPTIVVSKPVNSEISDLLRNTAYNRIDVGDRLLSINDLTFYKWKKKHQNAIGGSTESHSQRLALRYLTSRHAALTQLPDEDFIKLKFKSRGDIIYEVNVPYMSAYRHTCWEYSSKLYTQLTGVNLDIHLQNTVAVKANSHALSIKTVDDRTTSSQSTKPLVAARRIRKRSQNSKDQDTGRLSKRGLQITFHETSILELSWAIWRPDDQNMGIIKLTSFRCTSRTTNTRDVLKAIREVERLLTTVLKDTNSVLIDVREGDGGSMRFANDIPQLFKSKLEPFKVKYLMSKVTYNMFVHPPIDSRSSRNAWSKTPPKSKYSVLHDLTDLKTSITYDQVYTKPMGVFTSGDCASACEIMTGTVQSFKLGTVFGEDVTTAGAGAAVWSLDPELIFYDPTDFKPMPFTRELTSHTKDTFYNKMTVGHRALVRSGDHKGKPVEDVGIASDIIIRPKLEDILPGATVNSQYDYIGNYLIGIDERPAKTVCNLWGVL